MDIEKTGELQLSDHKIHRYVTDNIAIFGRSRELQEVNK